ncbi:MULTISPECIES: DNA polymerase III subunit beta [unclassified Desulfovibrio]|uniref:DNA polymerase III subunit beta n=1 Tax=unclassified Desulfovibrio TaxID=2593640 RepID=UPI000F5DB34C|nr:MULTISPECIES: DNA polymerase III subunit beta [unclassified Desulfovibrio]RRD69906.1 DNA polymerase III subunit beta [Desulfovibrio sp. OH1209_COT-279]RRD86486.1 DNA polymerase III subunit beta [Desulfovibrio sp. OH1186_COT-070]
MKISVTKEQIIEGLVKAAAIIPQKSGAQYLRSIWLKAENSSLFVMATDANIELTGCYPAQVFEPGLVGVQGRAFVDLVRQLPSGDITLRLGEGNSLQLEQGRRVYKLPVSGAEWFQPFSSFPEGDAVIWSGDFLQDILEKVTFCIGDDDSMEAIACLCMKPRENGRIDVCGLNGHQFALVSFTHDELAGRLPEDGILIQKKYLQNMKKWLGTDEIELNITEKRLYLRSMDKTETLALPLSGHKFPDYTVFMNRLSEDGVHPLTVDRRELSESLGRLCIFNTESEPATDMEMGSGEVLLSAKGKDVGSANENLEASYAGDIGRITFPTRNLLEILGHYASEKIDMMLTGVEGPCGIRGAEDPDYTVIIMPMKISSTTYYTEEDV